jgi:hypothetical protein
MHARLCAEAGDPALVRVLHEMRRLLGERYEAIVGGDWTGLAKSIPADAWARVHEARAAPRVLAQLREQYVVPILERVVRHEMLEWAAAAADRRGWRLKIYGKGWEAHETLGRFAAGPLEHGEDLRSAYRSAAVHLHASMATLVHQRVMECALSGGVPVCRVIGPNLGASRQAALLELVDAGVAPDEVGADGGLRFRTAAHEPLRRYAALLRSVGMRAPEVVTLGRGAAEQMATARCAFVEATPESLFGDLGGGCFRSGAGLELLVHTAVREPRAREARSAAIAARVIEGFSHEAAVRRIVALVGRVVGAGGSPGGGPEAGCAGAVTGAAGVD